MSFTRESRRDCELVTPSCSTPCQGKLVILMSPVSRKLDQLPQQVQQLHSAVVTDGTAMTLLGNPSGEIANAEPLRQPQIADSNHSLPSASIPSNILRRQQPADCLGLSQSESFEEIQQAAENIQALRSDSQGQASTYAVPQPQACRLEAVALPATRARSIDHVNLSSQQVDVLFRRSVFDSNSGITSTFLPLLTLYQVFRPLPPNLLHLRSKIFA